MCRSAPRLLLTTVFDKTAGSVRLPVQRAIHWPQNPTNVQSLGAWGTGTKEGAQSNLRPLLRSIDAPPPGCGGTGTLGRGYHVEQDWGTPPRRGIVNVILRFFLPSSALDGHRVPRS